jgi:hypothetical protein
MITPRITSQNWKTNSSIMCLRVDGISTFQRVRLELLLWMKACHVYCICWNLTVLWWGLHKPRMFLCVTILQLLKSTKLICTKCIVIYTFHFNLIFFLKSHMFNANTSCKITQDWVISLNDGIEHLTFGIIG